jgi:hypothetical protein
MGDYSAAIRASADFGPAAGAQLALLAATTRNPIASAQLLLRALNAKPRKRAFTYYPQPLLRYASSGRSSGGGVVGAESRSARLIKDAAS